MYSLKCKQMERRWYRQWRLAARDAAYYASVDAALWARTCERQYRLWVNRGVDVSRAVAMAS